MIISRLPSGGGSKGELHGATILVIAQNDDFKGQLVELLLGDVVVKKTIFNEEGQAIFSDILDPGVYTAKSLDITTVSVSISINDIFNKKIYEASMSLRIYLELGKIYSMAGYNWMCCEELTEGYVLQGSIVSYGYWPGFTMAKFGGANVYYNQNIDGQDIHEYSSATSSLYNEIKNAEKIGVSYGSGLFLLSAKKVGCSSVKNYESGSGFYWTYLADLAEKDTIFSYTSGCALGDSYEYTKAFTIVKGASYLYAFNQNLDNGYFGIAPAFNLDPTKAVLDGTTILIK